MMNSKILRNLFFLVDLIVALYIISAPALPQVVYALGASGKTSYERGVRGGVQDTNVSKLTSTVPDKNTLVVPAIGVDGVIYEGNSASILDKGIWHRPRSSTPDLGGNTVLVAHRFLYTSGPNTFYNLDKIKVGNRFALFWHGVRYIYEVNNIEVVSPSDVSIEAPTKDAMVTLWSCTPIFIANKRLVVQAKLVTQS